MYVCVVLCSVLTFRRRRPHLSQTHTEQHKPQLFNCRPQYERYYFQRVPKADNRFLVVVNSCQSNNHTADLFAIQRVWETKKRKCVHIVAYNQVYVFECQTQNAHQMARIRDQTSWSWGSTKICVFLFDGNFCLCVCVFRKYSTIFIT